MGDEAEDDQQAEEVKRSRCRMSGCWNDWTIAWSSRGSDRLGRAAGSSLPCVHLLHLAAGGLDLLPGGR